MLPSRPEISEILQWPNGLLGRGTLAPSVVTTRPDSAVAARNEDGRVDAVSRTHAVRYCLVSSGWVKGAGQQEIKGRKKKSYMSSNKTQLICSFESLMSAI